MAKYNVVTKNKREHSQDRKRRAHGDPNSGKLKQRTDHHVISGKRKRKLQRRDKRVGFDFLPPPRPSDCCTDGSLMLVWWGLGCGGCRTRRRLRW
jgi:hypothetical protein